MKPLLEILEKSWSPRSNTYLDPLLLWWEEAIFTWHWDGITMAEAYVNNNCEGVLKSIVSMFENHFDEKRNGDEVTDT